jgi:predicted nucleotidyltransferase
MSILDKYLIEFYKLCELYKVERIYLFGSALSSDFNEKSDIDFLVKFKPIDLQKYFDNYLGFKEKLENLFSRKVDLVEEQTLKNPILIKSIENSKSLIYG